VTVAGCSPNPPSQGAGERRHAPGSDPVVSRWATDWSNQNNEEHDVLLIAIACGLGGGYGLFHIGQLIAIDARARNP
jgi:hypothetical protein